MYLMLVAVVTVEEVYVNFDNEGKFHCSIIEKGIDIGITQKKFGPTVTHILKMHIESSLHINFFTFLC